MIGTEESNAAVASMAEGVFPIAFGVGTAIGLLLSVFMLLLGQFPFALIAFGTAVAAFATGWFKYRASTLKQPASGSQSGRAPYRKAQCKPNLAFANDLASVVTELEAWFHENKWPIHSKTLSSVREQAKRADASRNFPESIRCYIQDGFKGCGIFDPVQTWSLADSGKVLNPVNEADKVSSPLQSKYGPSVCNRSTGVRIREIANIFLFHAIKVVESVESLGTKTLTRRFLVEPDPKECGVHHRWCDDHVIGNIHQL